MSANVDVEGFYCHDKRSISFPVGVTLIVGLNGSGKSSLAAEPFAWGIYGKTLRGGSPGDAPAVRITLPKLVIDRRRGKKSTALNIEVEGHAVAYETATKAQEALELHLGLDFAGWRRTHVFSAAGVAQFSEATDAERKRLLEGLLGLDRFDAAQAKCRDDLKAAKTRRQVRATSLAVLRRVFDECKVNVQACREEVEAAEVPPEQFDLPSEEDVVDLTSAVEQSRVSLAAAEKVRDELMLELDRKSNTLKEVEAAAASGVCRTCQRPFDNHDPVEHTRTVGLWKTEVASARGRFQKQAVAVQAGRDALRAGEQKLREIQAALEAADQAAANHESTLKLARAQLAAHEARFRQADADLELEELADEADAAEVGILEKVDKVLGLKGARALVLGSALDAIKAEANALLSELAPGVTVDIYTDAGSIGLRVVGFGAGGGYENLSTGERCRIDIALLVAIASVAPSIPGLPLVFDDVFGTLDEDGVEAVARLLVRLGRRRPVAVVTQLSTLSDWLTPSAAQVVHL